MTKTAKTTAKAVKAAAPKKAVAQVPAPAVPAVENEDTENAALEQARKESAPMTIRLVGAYSYSGGGAPFFRKGGTATLARRAAEKLLKTGLFEIVEE